MITQIETALAAFIAARFAAADPVVTVPTRAATGNVPMPEDRSVIVVECGKPEHQGGGMWDTVLSCIVRSPANVKGVTTATHAAAESALAAAFGIQETERLTEISTAITAQLASHACCGYHVVGWQPGREDTNWLPTFDVKLGIDPAA